MTASATTEPIGTVPERDSRLNGLLIVDKPGHPSPYMPTSHDVVASVRRWSGQRRIGHTGTLDPLASGVLVLCLGRATRLVEYYQGHNKQYWAQVALGAATDTYDALGAVTATASVSDVPDIDAARVERALDGFRGEITQTPPAYSAIKQEGEPLHRRARRGEAVEVPPRQVTMHRLELLEFDPAGSVRLRIVCSAGAYMRSLAHDLGRVLGTHAHLAALRREAAGPFTLEHAHSLPEIETAANAHQLDELLLPPGTGLELPKLYPDPDSLTRLGHGQEVLLPNAIQHDRGPQEPGPLAQAIAPDGSLAGIVRRLGPAQSQAECAIWRAAKWLNPA